MIADSPITFDSRKLDFDYCEAIIKEHSKTFYAGFSKLPLEKAKSVYAVYAFCRKADDIADLYKDIDQLDVLYEQLRQFELGNVPDEPIWRALEVVFSTYDMDITPFYDMLIGQKNDLFFNQPENYGELSEYAYYVAGSVGLMLLPILSNESGIIQEPAKKLGEAMQITNILRDIGEDYRMGRVYLPKDLLAKYEISSRMFQNEQPTDSLIKMWENLAQKAEKLYDESMEMFPWIDTEAREPLLLASRLYAEILNEVRKNNYNMLSQRNFVSKWRAFKLSESVKKEIKCMSND